MIESTPSIYTAPESHPTPVPHRAQVVVLGAGLTGLAVASRLRNEGVDAVVVEEKPRPAFGMATRGMGIASMFLLDPPFRLIEALGVETAKDVLRFSSEGVDAWGDALLPCGVGYATKGTREHGEVQANIDALVQLGVSHEPWEPTAASGLSPGWLVHKGGTLNLESESRSMLQGVPVLTGTKAIAIEDDGLDLAVYLSTGERILTDIVVMTGGAQITPWAADKFHCVRHQAIATEPVDHLTDIPIHIQYGYTSFRQLPNGTITLSGCRWATPHLEVGETDDNLIQPDVHDRLVGFLHTHWPQCSAAAITHQWSSIMSFSCDGLPVIGPLPGRSRIISCGGFGAFSPSLTLRAARAVTDGILTGTSEGVPACFSTHRFG